MQNYDYINIFWQFSQGIWQTLVVTISCFLTGIGVGLTAVSLRWTLPWSGRLLDIFTFILRAIPILVLVFLVYFGMPLLGFKLSPFVTMNATLGLVTGANLAEVFRGALLSIDSSELLAAKSMGMSPWQVLVCIAIPQMLRFSFPGAINEFTSTLKNSPFACVIGISELTRHGTTLTSTINHGLQIYLTIGILYFIIPSFRRLRSQNLYFEIKNLILDVYFASEFRNLHFYA